METTEQTLEQTHQQDPLPSDTGTTPASEPERICGYLVHPAAALLPDPTPEEFERMVADIRDHGIIKPVILFDPEDPDASGAYADGGDTAPMILDGRSRARIWELLGRDFYRLPTAELAEVSPQHCSDPIGFVLSMNAVRRNLTPAQIAAVWIQGNAMKLEVQRAEAATRQKEGKTPQPTGGLGSGKVSDQIAVATGVGATTVEKVLKVQKVAPEKVKEIAEGASVNKVLKAVAPKRDPYCAHANPRANCPECCRHGRIKEHCISCSGLGNTLPAVSKKPTKMKSKTQIKKEAVEARKVERQTDLIIAWLRPGIFLSEDPHFDIDGTVKEMVESFHELLSKSPAVPSSLVVPTVKQYIEELVFQTEVYRGFLAAVEKVEAA
jgi:hypothetical protein